MVPALDASIRALRRGHTAHRNRIPSNLNRNIVTMKPLLAIALGIACFSTASLRAAEKMLRAAVVAQSSNAELRANHSIRAAGRRTFEVGEVYECAATTGRFEELKIDATHVALVPTTALRTRECTAAELTQAQAKFNVLSHDNQRNAHKALTSAKKQAEAQAGACSTCSVAQAAARKNLAAAKKAYTEQSKALRLKQQTLAREALDWAASLASPSTAAK